MQNADHEEEEGGNNTLSTMGSHPVPVSLQNTMHLKDLKYHKVLSSLLHRGEEIQWVDEVRVIETLAGRVTLGLSIPFGICKHQQIVSLSLYLSIDIKREKDIEKQLHTCCIYLLLPLSTSIIVIRYVRSGAGNPHLVGLYFIWNLGCFLDMVFCPSNHPCDQFGLWSIVMLLYKQVSPFKTNPPYLLANHCIGIGIVLY